MGVWIETGNDVTKIKMSMSHPVWVCGLKQVANDRLDEVAESHPVWVCGLKQGI